MKIYNDLVIYNNRNFNYTTQPTNKMLAYSPMQNDTVSFTGMGKPSQTDILNAGKRKLIKQFDKILETIPKEISEEELGEILINQWTAFERGLINKIAKLEEKAISLNKMTNIKPQQYINMRNELLKELNRIKKARPEPINFASGNKDNINDFVLINKMKNAVISDDFNLKRVFIEHYSGLQDMKTIEEVKERYPDIILPIRPETVIADKIVTKSLNRDFFEELDELIELGKNDEANKLVNKNLTSAIKALTLKKHNINENEFVSKIEKELFRRISFTIKKVRKQNSFSFIPISIKQKGEILSDDDYKLISTDFDKFVLGILREQFLKFSKTKDITSQGINAASIKDKDYKIEKIPSKILSLISEGMELQKTQRNYEKFTPEQFIDRLYFYIDKFGDNEQVFKHLLEFGTCRFEGEDSLLCSKMLREFDAVLDKEKTLDEALDTIKDIYPKGTEKLNELEYQKGLKEIAKEQKRLASQKNYTKLYDDVVNFLYKNNMTYAAGVCSKYRPTFSNIEELKISDFLLNTVMGEVSKGKITNKARLDSKISRWSTYNEYLTNDIQDDILKEAQAYATKDGKIDIFEAGKYIMNREMINTYPRSLEYAKNKEILQLAANISSKEKACEYLCKFDSYNDMPVVEKTKILEILKHFNTSDDIDKEMLRIICENHYSKVDTTTKSVINSGGKSVDATITSNAKQEIMDYYKFPAYLEYLSAFERALSTHTSAKGNSGIKIFGSNNNAQIYEMEIKIKFKNSVARLVSTNNNYIFDKFIPLGLH